MIPTTNVREVKSSDVIDGAEFGISVADSAHIMKILRDTLYTDKILAVLREYSANAWDSHRTSGKATLPIRVHIPTLEDPVLRIQDFGLGLSREDVLTVYTQYGASTKRDNNIAVGMLGIGCKSGFAYSDTFTVISCFGGIKSIYSAMLDSTDKGIISLVCEVECGTETGITIEIPVKQTDIHDFASKARYLYANFSPRPQINIEIADEDNVIGSYKSGEIYSGFEYYGNGLMAIMGCVPYRVNINQIYSSRQTMPDCLNSLKARLFLDIGDVDVSASREELKYSDKTKAAIVNKVESLLSEHVAHTLKTIADTTKTDWERRIAAQSLQSFVKFAPKDFVKWTVNHVRIDEHTPKIPNGTFTVDATGKQVASLSYAFRLYAAGGRGKKSQTNFVSVNKEARIIVRDDGRTLKGFDLESTDFVAIREKGLRFSTDVLGKLVTKMIEAAEIKGIKVCFTSQLPWTRPANSSPRTFNAKHGQTVFKYVHSNYTFPGYSRRGYKKKGHASSDCWDSVYDYVASDNDIYVEIQGFRCTDSDFHNLYEKDLRLCKKLNISMPAVVAYKITVKSPSRKRKGLTYEEWRKKKFFDMILDDETVGDRIKIWDAFSAFDYYKNLDALPGIISKIIGTDHVLYKLFESLQDAKALNKKLNGNGSYSRYDDALNEVLSSPEFKSNSRVKDSRVTTNLVNELASKYPLLSLADINYSLINEKNCDKWCEYIKLVDEKEEKNEN